MAISFTKWNSETKTSDPVVLGEGATVGYESTYLGDGDSSYWGVYFDFESGEFKNAGGGYTPSGIVADASEPVKEAYAAKQAAERAAGQAKAAAIRLRQDYLDAQYEAATPRKGKTVKVVSGRKIPVGTVAEVAWYGESNYGGFRVALLIDGEKVYTASHNVEVVTQEQEAVAA